MIRIKIEVIKLEEDKYFVVVENPVLGISQVTCKKKDAQRILAQTLE